MLTRDTEAFLALARRLPADFGAATARAVMLVRPDGFCRAEQSAADNLYMAQAEGFDSDAAIAQHAGLHTALGEVVPTICFAGDANTPDAVFPNNVFGLTAQRLIIGRMRHPVRQREAQRADIVRFFADMLGREVIDLSQQPAVCELTGALVIDRARGLGFFGLSERCDAQGAALVHAAFGLRASLLFDLAEGEYHTNVVLAVLAGRAAVICPDGFADAKVVDAIASLYGTNTLRCSPAEHAAFVGNCISLSNDTVWMSQRAADALSHTHRQQLADAGFSVKSVPLDAIEAGGGSLRCCVAEVF